MTKQDRLEATFALKETDKTPVIGGWIACPAHIMELVGVDEKTYWDDPVSISAEAYRTLDVDGVIGVFVPRNRDDFRSVDASSYQSAHGSMSFEEACEWIDRQDSPEEYETRFDFHGEYEKFKSGLVEGQDLFDEIVWMPAQWDAGARISWYGDIGYENFFAMVGLHPDRMRKLVELGGARGRARSRLIARAVIEGLFPHAVLMGEDICSQRGPMISPDFMERFYIPQLTYGLQPLLEAGCRPVWHCDGDVRQLLDMLIDAGVCGFQGFQPECGMHLEEIVQRRTRTGERLVIFGPLSVTTELPVLSADEIEAKVRAAIEICRGKAHLALFTSNTINPDVPLENIKAIGRGVDSCR